MGWCGRWGWRRSGSGKAGRALVVAFRCRRWRARTGLRKALWSRCGGWRRMIWRCARRWRGQAGDERAQRQDMVSNVEAGSSELYLDLLKKCLTGWVYEESGWKFIVKAMLNGQLVQLPPDVAMVQKT